MRRLSIISFLVFIIAGLLISVSVSAIDAQASGLFLISPTTCPDGGCAAGQRLNFQVDYAITPQFATGSNTQICIYAPSDGVAGSLSLPWADFSDGWISSSGMISGQPYTSGETGSVCSSNTPAGQKFLAGAFATIPTSVNDRLQFAFQINPSTNINGTLEVRLYETTFGGGNWVETAAFNQPLAVAPMANPVYVAEKASDCSGFSPCFLNSGDDAPDGIGTGLRDAVRAQNPGGDILILNNYIVKDHGILIDKPVTIQGQATSRLTYIGSTCDDPMLRITAGATLKKLTINDGNCVSPSRTLIDVNSSSNVTIEHNTLTYGKQAIHVHDNLGGATIAFNHLTNNLDYAVLREFGVNTGEINLYANNIHDNRSGYQVNCNNRGLADHNFWGQTVPASSAALSCGVSNAKQLGAPIVLNTDSAGVDADRHTVTATNASAFDGAVTFQHMTGNDFDIVIVNHGQGTAANIPFGATAGVINPCSQFYDVFLTDNATASNLTLGFKYNLNASCTSAIESAAYCGQVNSALYPLYWFDPANSVTDGWDRTGQNPTGSGAGGASGQLTTCNTSEKRISVSIDNTGRPGIFSDLNFTPFVVGFPQMDGIKLSQFTAQFDLIENDLRWITTSETNVQGFHILRSETQEGVYNRISSLIPAIGNPNIGGIYTASDRDIVFTRTYYYKLEVINLNGQSIETHGPVSVITSTATPTITRTPTPTVTRTGYPTLTFTPYYYRSPTFYYRPATATPRRIPTQVRTYGPTPQYSLTPGFKPTLDPTLMGTSYPDQNGYPVESPVPIGTEGYPLPDGEQAGLATLPGGYPPEQVPDGTVSPDGENPSTGSPSDQADNQSQPSPIRWVFLLIGAVSGLTVLMAVSVILFKMRLP